MKRRRHNLARSTCGYCHKPFFHRADRQPEHCGTACARLDYLNRDRGDDAPLRGGQLPREQQPDEYTRRLADGFARWGEE